jgi:hypothetical protein
MILIGIRLTFAIDAPAFHRTIQLTGFLLFASCNSCSSVALIAAFLKSSSCAFSKFLSFAFSACNSRLVGTRSLGAKV